MTDTQLTGLAVCAATALATFAIGLALLWPRIRRAWHATRNRRP